MIEITIQVMERGVGGAIRPETVQAFQLHSMDLVHLQGNEVVPRCNLYRRYFGDWLNVGR